MIVENEAWGRKIRELAGDVAGVLRTARAGALPALEITDGAVAEAASEILASCFGDFVLVTRRTAPGATYQVTATFLFDEFRDALAVAANKSLARFAHCGTQLVTEFFGSPFFSASCVNQLAPREGLEPPT